MSEPAVVFDDVTLRRGQRTILDRVSFSIASGEFVGILGENGAGKSTLLRLALGLIAPTSGAVRLFGRPPGSQHGVAGYVPQRIEIDPDLPLRARDYVALGFDGRRFGFAFPNAKRAAAVDAALEAVDARHLAERSIGRLSGGEQQRLAIAQAIVGSPRVVMLDEPFASLDLGNTREIVQLVARLAHERQIAMLLVAHDVNPLLESMDRVLYIARARVAIGRVEQIINEDTLSRLFDRPVDVLRVRGRVIVVAGDERPHA